MMKPRFTSAFPLQDRFHTKVRVGEVSERQIKLGQTLSSLIERGGYSRNRQSILSALDISPAALSQYARDQTRPSFQKLVMLADFFGVSLEYLVYGEVNEPVPDHSLLTSYIENSWQQVSVNTRRHTALVGRMGRVLAERVDQVARELAESPTSGREGLIQDVESARLERHCFSVDILSIDLEFDLIAMPRGDAAGGPFLEIVAANLSRGCRYRYIVPTTSDHTVRRFRSLLLSHVEREPVRKNLMIRRTEMPLISGAVLYRLDLEALQAQESALLNQMHDYIGAGGELGYVLRPNADSDSDMIMDSAGWDRARSAFDSLWNSSTLA